MIEGKLKFGIKVDKYEKDEDMWSFGICLSHWLEETYIYANFWRYSISIGKFIR